MVVVVVVVVCVAIQNGRRPADATDCVSVSGEVVAPRRFPPYLLKLPISECDEEVDVLVDGGGAEMEVEIEKELVQNGILHVRCRARLDASAPSLHKRCVRNLS